MLMQVLAPGLSAGALAAVRAASVVFPGCRRPSQRCASVSPWRIGNLPVRRAAAGGLGATSFGIRCCGNTAHHAGGQAHSSEWRIGVVNILRMS